MDLVDEEHAARLERGEERGDVALALERRAGGLHERHVELGGDDLRERGLAQARRPGEQQVVERVAAARAASMAIESCSLSALLADEVLQPARPQRASSSSSAPGRRGSGCARSPARSPRSALAMSSSARVALGAGEQLVGLGGRVAEPEQPSRASVRGSSPRA